MSSVGGFGGEARSFTTHYGGRKWMDDRVGPRTHSSSNSSGSGSGGQRSSDNSNSSIPSSPSASFAPQPNPHVLSVERIVSPVTAQHAVALGVTALAASVVLYKLYQASARRNREQQQLLATDKRVSFGGGKSAEAGRDAPKPKAVQQHSWLWRLFKRSEPKPKPPARARHSRGGGRSPSPRNINSPASSSSSSQSPPARMPSSSPSPLPPPLPSSGNEHYRAFLLECTRLAERGIVISNPTAFYLKRQRMRDSNVQAMRASPSGCESNVHILASFDRTLTTLRQTAAPNATAAPPTCLTSQSLLEQFLPSSYADASQQLFRQYYPLETSRHLAPEAKAAYMAEWWHKQQALLSLDEFRLTRNRIAHTARTTVEQGQLRLRAALANLLHQPDNVEEAAALGPIDALCARFDVPMVVFSGGILDIIEQLLLTQGVRVNNSNRSDLSELELERCARSNVHVVANALRWGTLKTPAVHRAATSSSAHGSPSAAPVSLASRLHPALSSSSLLSPSSNSLCLGFDQRFLVHSLNKTYHRVLEQTMLLRQLSSKTNVIVLGSTLQDARLADGLEQRPHELARLAAADEEAQRLQQLQQQQQQLLSHHFDLDHAAHAADLMQQQQPQQSQTPPQAAPAVVGEVLRVGFLNSGVSEKLDSFKQAFDVVLLPPSQVHDSEGEFVRSLVAFVCGVDERQIAAAAAAAHSEAHSTAHAGNGTLPPPMF